MHINQSITTQLIKTCNTCFITTNRCCHRANTSGTANTLFNHSSK